MATQYTSQTRDSKQRPTSSARPESKTDSQSSLSIPSTDTMFEKAKSFLEGKEDPAKAIEYLKSNWKAVLGMVAVLGIQAYLARSANSSKTMQQ